MSVNDDLYYDEYSRRFGRPVSQDRAQASDYNNRQNYGSNTRYNQLQNHPYNSIAGTPVHGGYNTEDYIGELIDGRQNNIMDMDSVRAIAQRQTLNNLLRNIFTEQYGSVTRRNQLQNYPNNTYDYTREEAAQMQPNNIDDVLFYLRGINE